MANRKQRIERLERARAEATVHHWLLLLKQGNPRAWELYEIATQRKEAKDAER